VAAVEIMLELCFTRYINAYAGVHVFSSRVSAVVVFLLNCDSERSVSAVPR